MMEPSNDIKQKGSANHQAQMVADQDNATIKSPILAMLAALVFALLITTLSLGLLGPLGMLLFGLSMVWLGIWLLLHQTSRTSRVCAIVLIVSPVIGVYVMFFSVMFLR